MANKKTKVKTGKGLAWALSMWDEKGFLLGVHFSSGRKISKAKRGILKAALLDAAEKFDAMETAPDGHNDKAQARTEAGEGRCSESPRA